ncbi:tRNA pseudouridine(13) synthase TruD [Alienimonas californiensis]|uniref:tRNA pseudouridine synthase D n=1 Tax=Alienimonas californiensis TaxID=2527989 RepID=A0A517PCF4_9PLAN|nr:tRNA pseudouridine(13) synthase TruD [Alienimonas californiensis]QDT17055.1 tRNA pseudouridine synthase D [Alienimonas californiensis]
MTDAPAPHHVPRLHGDLPGVGGALKAEPADFRVSEVPAYEPCGEGPHLYLRVRKTDVSAEALTAHLARTLEVGKRDVGVAGLKDRRAITEQWVSVPATAEPRLAEANAAGVEVLEARRHTNKLKTGHLRGNRFDVRLRGVLPDAVDRAAPIVERLRTVGFANAFGDQRFGKGNSTLALGLGLLRGEKTDRDVPAKRRKFLVRLALSAAQSDLFNACLADRLSDGTAGTVLPGDVMQVRGSGGLFLVPELPMKQDLAEEQSRADLDETAVTGPLFGPRMKGPTGDPARREAAILAAAGLPDNAFRRFAKLTPGARRPYLVRPADLAVTAVSDEDGVPGLRIRFYLPSGSYATVLLRELIGDESPSETS